MGLLGWWQLENDRDSSGNGKHITTLSGVTLTDGKIGKCYEFTSGSRMIASGITVGHSCTITAWGYSTSWASSTMLFSLNSASFSGPDLYFTGGVICWNTGDGASNPFKNNGANVTQPSLNTWHHYAVVVDAEKNKVYLYLNGEYYGEANYKSPYQSNRNFVIGNYSASTSYAWRGRIDDVRLYDYCLSPKEIKELSKALVLHYKFDDFQEPTVNLYTAKSQMTAHNVSVEWLSDHHLKFNSAGGTSGVYFNTSLANIKPNTDYCLSFMIKKTSGTFLKIRGHIESTFSIIETRLNGEILATPYNAGIPVDDISTPYKVEVIIRSGANTNSFYYNWIQPNFSESTVVGVEVYDIQVEEKPYATPFTPDERSGTVHDCSGYDNHAELALDTTPRWVGKEESKIGSGAYEFNGSNTITTGRLFHDNVNQCHTVSAWVYPTNPSAIGNQQLVNFNRGYRIYHTAGGQSLMYVNSGTNDHYVYGPVIPAGQWTLVTWVYDKATLTCRVYYNGVLSRSSGNFDTSDVPSGFSSETIFGSNFYGLIDDVRVYATALSDEDIKELYQTRGNIDSHGNLYVQDIKEPENIGLSANNAIKNKTFAGGLGRYTQSHCQVTLTDRGLRIYRTPNLTQATNGNVMYGGMRISLLDLLPGGIQEGRRYKVTFDVEGQTYQSNSPISITNNMGWGGGGLTPNPLVIKNDSTLGANFQGHKKCEYIFEVRDSIYKVCTTSYSSFVAGNIYPSYNHLTFHFGYGTTGDIGTDIYITNFKIMDITDTQLNSISDKGIATYDDFSELGPMNGIIAWWPLDGHTQDYSGNNNHGTLGGSPSITTFARQRGYSFLSGGDRVNIAPTGSGISTMTLSAWHKWDTGSTNWRTVFGHTGNFHHLIFNNNRSVCIFDGSTRNFGYSSPDNDWHLYTVIIESGTRAELYVDGIYKGQTVTTLNLSTHPVYVIGNWGGGSYPVGSLADIRIYNRALSPEEIKILYDVTKPNAIPMQLSSDGTVYLSGQLREV